MRVRRHPKPAPAIFQWFVLASEVDAFALIALSAVLAALGEIAGMDTELGCHGCVGGDPIGEGVFAVLDDTGKRRG